MSFSAVCHLRLQKSIRNITTDELKTEVDMDHGDFIYVACSKSGILEKNQLTLVHCVADIGCDELRGATIRDL